MNISKLAIRVAYEGLKLGGFNEPGVLKLMYRVIDSIYISQNSVHKTIDEFVFSRNDMDDLTSDEKSEIISIKNKMKLSYKYIVDANESLGDLIYNIKSHKL